MCVAGMGMSQADAVTGGRKPVVKGNMGVDDPDLDEDDVCSLSDVKLFACYILCARICYFYIQTS